MTAPRAHSTLVCQSGRRLVRGALPGRFVRGTLPARNSHTSFGRRCGAVVGAHRAEDARGFTLVEMVIVVAIVAMIVGVAATSVADMSRAALRKMSGIVASAMKAAYDDAALSGKTYRLAFVIGDPKTNAPSVIRVESSKEVLAFDGETSTLGRALQGRSDAIAWDEFATGATSPDGSVGVDSLDGPSADLLDKVLGTVGKNGAHANSSAHHRDDDEEDPSKDTGFAEAAKNIDVDDDVRVMSVWTEGMEKPVAEGEAYVYFFPNGYAQDAIVHLQDEDHRVISVKLAALTGMPTIVDGYVESADNKK
jgi:general secretion pathway protein H